eukprot:scaffold11_cov257-Pinguiococcus_pyrenoidosus.AAC.57
MRSCNAQRRLPGPVHRVHAGAATGKQGYHVCAPMHCGETHRRRSTRVFGLLVRTEIEQQRNDLHLASRASHVQCRQGTVFKGGPKLGKSFDHVGLSRSTRHQQGRVSSDRGGSQGGTRLQQEINVLQTVDRSLRPEHRHNTRVPLLRGDVQGGLPAFGQNVPVGLVVKQHLHHGNVASLCALVKRRQTHLVLGVHLRTMLQKQCGDLQEVAAGSNGEGSAVAGAAVVRASALLQQLQHSIAEASFSRGVQDATRIGGSPALQLLLAFLQKHCNHLVPPVPRGPPEWCSSVIVRDAWIGSSLQKELSHVAVTGFGRQGQGGVPTAVTKERGSNFDIVQLRSNVQRCSSFVVSVIDVYTALDERPHDVILSCVGSRSQGRRRHRDPALGKHRKQLANDTFVPSAAREVERSAPPFDQPSKIGMAALEESFHSRCLAEDARKIQLRIRTVRVSAVRMTAGKALDDGFVSAFGGDAGC